MNNKFIPGPAHKQIAAKGGKCTCKQRIWKRKKERKKSAS